MNDEFTLALFRCQDALYAYILTLLPNMQQAEDVLQNTNVVLCRQAEQFPEIRNFVGWACKIAYFEVLSHRKRRQRERLVFDDGLVESLGKATPESDLGPLDERRRALQHCLGKLSQRQRSMILQRYSPDGSVGDLARDLGRPDGSVRQSLYRIRQALTQCVQNFLAPEPT